MVLDIEIINNIEIDELIENLESELYDILLVKKQGVTHVVEGIFIKTHTNIKLFCRKQLSDEIKKNQRYLK